MKNFILGAVVVVILGGAGYALASGSALSLVDHSADKTVLKYYDSDSNVVCYVVNSGSGYAGNSGISCLKNTPVPTTVAPTTKISF